jgi:hypothetical protein
MDKKQLDLELPHIAHRSLKNIFMGQLRAIMDGMYFQFQSFLLGHGSLPSFQSYALSWLSTFTIDETSRSVV